MNFLVVVLVIAVMIALRFVKLNTVLWLIVWWIGLYVILRYGIDPPLPSSIVGMFMFIISLAILVFMSADSQRLASVGQSIVRFMTDKSYRIPLVLVLVAVPLLVAWKVYSDATAEPEAPVSGRTIHPVPPTEIQFRGKKIDLVSAVNPYRALETSDPAQFAEHVENGRKVYYQNCVFCHGDNMRGDGIYAHGFDPIPANFQDPTTIAMLQEGYLFWRISKGGPGLPDESTPWSSAMPAWEQFLTEDQVWDVILFLYDHTGTKPRAREEVTE